MISSCDVHRSVRYYLTWSVKAIPFFTVRAALLRGPWSANSRKAVGKSINGHSWGGRPVLHDLREFTRLVQI